MSFICDTCFCVIKENEICAVPEKAILVTCCDCLFNRCCVRGCDNTVPSEYECLKRQQKYNPLCYKHQFGQCAHDIDCINPRMKDSLYCNTHRCRWIAGTGNRCVCEGLDDTRMCPHHTRQARQIKK